MLGNDNEGAINVPSGIEFQQLDSGRLHTWYGDFNHFEIPLLHHSLRVTLLFAVWGGRSDTGCWRPALFSLFLLPAGASASIASASAGRKIVRRPLSTKLPTSFGSFPTKGTACFRIICSAPSLDDDHFCMGMEGVTGGIKKCATSVWWTSSFACQPRHSHLCTILFELKRFDERN